MPIPLHMARHAMKMSFVTVAIWFGAICVALAFGTPVLAAIYVTPFVLFLLAALGRRRAYLKALRDDPGG